MPDEDAMTIETLASRAGTATSTVRMYQSRGLLPPPERRGRVGFYGEGHLARLRLVAQLQQEGYSLEGIKRLIEAWQEGRSLDDVLGLETQVAGIWAAEQPVRLTLAQFARLFSGQKVTPRVIRRAARMGLVGLEGTSVVIRSPRFLRIGTELTGIGIPIDEMLDELEALQAMTVTIAGRFTRVFEHHMWDPFVAAGLPADQVRPLTESLQRLAALAEDVVQTALRDALRRQASGFLAEQAARLDDAGIRAGLRAVAEEAGLDVDAVSG